MKHCHKCGETKIILENRPGPVGPTGPTGSCPSPTFMAVNNSGSESVSVGSPIIWDVVESDTSGMYNTVTGVATVPSDGLWQITARVTIDQSGMDGFPASAYQHIIIVHKSIPFPDGSNDRFFGFYQERFAATTPTKQVFLQGTEVILLTANEEVEIQLFTVVFEPVVTIPDTDISGAVGLNTWTMTRLGD